MPIRRVLVCFSLGLFGAAAGGCASGGAAKTSADTAARAPAPRAKTQDPERAAAVDFENAATAIKARGSSPDYEDVARRMSKLTEQHPEHGLAWYNLAVAEERLGRSESAVAAYQRAIAANDDLREARENLAALAAREGNAREAVGHLRELVAQDPGAADARVALARHYVGRGQLEEARSLCIEALTFEPKNIGAYCVLGDAALQANNVLRVRLLTAQGLKIEPEAACLHDLRGRVAQKEGDPGAALRHFQRAVKADSSKTETQFRIGEISLAYRDYNRAQGAFSTLTQADPKNAAAWVNLGIAQKAMGKPQEAEKSYQAGLDASDEPLPAAHYNLGLLYLRHLDRLDDAETQLKRYLQTAEGEGEEVYAWLEEIATRKQLAEDERLRAEEEARQAEIERMRQEEEARQKAALEKEVEKGRARARAAGEPEDPLLSPAFQTTDDAAQADSEVEEQPPEPEAPKPPKRRAAPRPRRSDPEPSDPLLPSDFE